jgi:rfaE bifunctional protein nucleotidyltransferase chain/domain
MVGPLHEVAAQVRKLQAAGKTVVFTNGCFDLLHSGHTELLRKARDLGDALVVAINSDSSVARIKGRGRPIIPHHERAELLDGMEMVDFVCWFEDDTPLEAILTIRPDILVKGADWTDNIVGQREVEGWGGKVFGLPLVEGQSTTGIVDRVLARYGNTGKANS